ncbi:Rieske (2Fe-2S) protein [Streptomyces sp. A7024]|uniref:Cytochrome bc1 complex Rieske iron-sulfur subunit n=1 Tax=Streptomyces coryli TaxID=1128680 RepID=A0A6G4U920_9ACTN|nr:Rieske (2Fe-2S) protein [Streptomyces coryli]NGN68735.1 Rieske (2Fe-2S) protein [Streptomyces coryli]
MPSHVPSHLPSQEQQPPTPARRTVLGTAAALAGTAALTACGQESGSGAGGEGAQGEGEGEGGGKATGPTPVELGPESEAPAKGAKLYKQQKIVLVREQGGGLKGYSAVCTHQGCTITNIKGDELICPCHGSRFDAANGEPTRGPAQVPLETVPVKVKGGKIIAG